MAGQAVTIFDWGRSTFPDRQNISFSFRNLTSAGITEVAAVATISEGPAYVASGLVSSYTVPAGKILRLTAIRHAMAASAAVEHLFTIRLTTTLTGNIIYQSPIRLTGAGVTAVEGTIVEGFEYPAGTVLQFSNKLTVASTGGSDIVINGLLYTAPA
jgi:hypothetical protein